MSMLQIKNISKSFQVDAKPVLKEISFELEAGEFAVLIGGNGSGKSTLFKLISGEYPLDSGEVYLEAQALSSVPWYKRSMQISTVSQDLNAGVVKEMTLLENLSLSFIRGQGASFGSVEKKREFFIDYIRKLELGLERYIDTPMQALSGGQKQMIALAMATFVKPKLLLLDEHCSALDPKSSQQLMKHTEKIVRDQAISTLMITHSLTDAIRYGQRLLMLREGRIILDVKGIEKQNMTVQGLLALYHEHVESTLL